MRSIFELTRLLIGMFILLQGVIALAEEPGHFLEFRSAANNPQTGYEKHVGSLTNELYLFTQPILTEVDVISAHLSGSTAVEVLFNVEGTKKLGEYTRQNIGKPLAIIVDGQVISAPIISAGIDSGRVSVNLPDSKTALELISKLPNRRVDIAPGNEKSDDIQPSSENPILSPSTQARIATPTVTSSSSLISIPGSFELPMSVRDVVADRLHRQVLVLTQDSRLHLFNENGMLVSSHTLASVQDLVAIDVDDDGNVYAVDRELHQLRKFSRASNYAADKSFGNNGMVGGLGKGNAQFNEPMDVQWVSTDASTWVADSGNHRLQRFSSVSGAFQLNLLTGERIARPVSLLADPYGLVTVIDGMDGDLAVFERDGTELSYRPNAVGVDPSAPVRASVDGISNKFGVVIPDPAKHALVLYEREGRPRGHIDLAASAPIALAYATYGNTEGRILVAIVGATRLLQLKIPDPSGESPVEIVTRFFSAVHQGSDATAYALVASQEVSLLKSVLADPLKGPKYRDLAGRIGGMSELSRSKTSAFVHCFVDPNTPAATPVTIGLIKDPKTGRWVIVEF